MITLKNARMPFEIYSFETQVSVGQQAQQSLHKFFWDLLFQSNNL